jgi:hypothetical protein
MVGKGLTRSIDFEYLKDVLYVGLVRGGRGLDIGVYGEGKPAAVDEGECDSDGALLIIE